MYTCIYIYIYMRIYIYIYMQTGQMADLTLVLGALLALAAGPAALAAPGAIT